MSTAATATTSKSVGAEMRSAIKTQCLTHTEPTGGPRQIFMIQDFCVGREGVKKKTERKERRVEEGKKSGRRKEERIEE